MRTPTVGWVLLTGKCFVQIFKKPANFHAIVNESVQELGLITLAPFALTLTHCVLGYQGFRKILANVWKRHRSGFSGIKDVEASAPDSEPNSRVLERGGTPESVEDGNLLENPKPYHYSSLWGDDEFRLLVIYPGLFDHDLEGEVIHTSFSNPRRPAYDVLSYTWADETGNADRSQTFLCEEDGRQSIIRITKNCEAALRRLRFSNRKRWMWIDAVCINQDHDSERTYQVSLMSKIYTSAQHVAVYTGESTPQTDKLFDWLNGLKTEDLDVFSRWNSDSLIADVAVNVDWFWKVGSERLSALVGGRGTDKQRVLLSEEELLGLIEEYFSRRWFRRIWVLQEVALPDIRNTTVICGEKNTTAIRALHALSLIYQSSAASIIRIFILLRKRAPNLKSPQLLDLLIETRDREAGDSRDKIFGILSISNSLDQGKFPPQEADYALTAQEVYMRYSKFFIQHHGPGFFLSLIKSEHRLQGLPSWAADWTAPWPNYKAVSGKEFAAASRAANEEDNAGGSSNVTDGNPILTLVRPRILHGYFTRNGHLDAENQICVEGMKSLGEDEVLIEMYPGLAALLRRQDSSYIFVRVCPHALSERGVEDLVERWSDVVVNLARPHDIPQPSEYLSLPETFNIR